MRTELKHLGFGLIIGILIMILLISGLILLNPSAAQAAINSFQPTSTFTPIPPTSTPTATSTSTPTTIPTITLTPTSTIIPTDTPTGTPTNTPSPVELLMDAGGLIFTGPLSNDQQISLYNASINYIAPTVKDSIRISKSINGVGYGDPSNICGPLSIAILRDAGLINNQVVPYDFWLLNPVIPEDQKTLARTFPSDSYSHSKFTTPLNKIDWQAFPLEPGDFLYIWHGSWGNFDHMLVVNRVDSNQRAYAVTNYGTPDGFIIGEVMLYDPTDPSAGIFHTWTKERDNPLGSTGFGGFELWRLRTP